jgi:hypothetical protein
LPNPDSNKLTFMVQTPVTDGSFEDVAVSALYRNDATSGGWTLSGPQAEFEDNESNPYATPYGEFFVTFYGESDINSVSQPVALASCKSGPYTLSYSYDVPFAENTASRNPCTLSVTYGGVTIDSVVLSDTSGGWITRTQVFTPAAGSGDISFIWDCSALLPVVDEIDLLLDNISVS